MLRAIDVARYLVEIALRGDEPDGISNLRLQKLLYYVQGWSLAVFGKTFFTDRIEAWKYGPVVCNVWQQLKDCGPQVITPDRLGEGRPLGAGERSFVEAVWDRYKEISPTGLSRLTHQEPPWVNARQGLPADASSCEEITPDALRDFFAPQAADMTVAGIDPARVYKSLEQFERGEGKSHKDVFARLRRA
jgi:uncharacterized phage-associated protein